MSQNTKILKFVIVGDEYVGKTSLIYKFSKVDVPEDFLPGVINHIHQDRVICNDSSVKLMISHVGGVLEECGDLRLFCFSDADVFVVCYSCVQPVNGKSSYFSVTSKWIPEIEQRCKKKKSIQILVSTKTDLRNDKDTIESVREGKNRFVSKEEGEELARNLGFWKYFECSSKTGNGVDSIFLEPSKYIFRNHQTCLEIGYDRFDYGTQLKEYGTKKWSKTKRVLVVGDETIGRYYVSCTIRGEEDDRNEQPRNSNNFETFEVKSSKTNEEQPIPKKQTWEVSHHSNLRYNTIRRLGCIFSDIVVLVVDIENAEQVENITKKWYPELTKNISMIIEEGTEPEKMKNFVRFSPVLLIGTRNSLLLKSRGKKVPKDDGSSNNDDFRLSSDEEEKEGENEDDNVDEKKPIVTKEEMDDLVKKLNFYGYIEFSTSAGQHSGMRNYLPLIISNICELKERKKYEKYLSKIRKKEMHVYKVVKRINDEYSELQYSQGTDGYVQNIPNVNSKIEKLRKDVRRMVQEIDTERNRNIMESYKCRVQELQGMKEEFKLLRNKLHQNSAFRTMISFSSPSFLQDQLFKAYNEFKRINNERIETLKTMFEKKHERITTLQMNSLEDKFSDFEYTQVLNSIFIEPNNNNNNNVSQQLLEDIINTSKHYMGGRNEEFEVLSLQGLSLRTVQSFPMKDHVFFGECKVSSSPIDGEKIVKPDGEGYLFRSYLPSTFARKKVFGMVCKANFSSGIRNKKGVEMDLRTGKLIYEGQYENDKRHGNGEEYEVKKFRCRRGVWKEGVLIETKKEYEFGMVSLREIGNQLVPKNEIGRGGNATVYEIVWKGNPRAAKIVTIPKGNASLSYGLISRTVRNSLSLQASFDHPHVIKCFGMIAGRHKVGYLMEKCVCDVNAVILKEKNSLSFKEKIRILLETADGMKYLHSMDIMNRDLKWSNVLLDQARRVVLTDLDTAREDETLWRNNVQNTSSAIGTSVFIAPELMSRKYDKRIDIFSYGIMIFCLVFGLVNPYSETVECPGCKSRIQTMNTFAFPTHVRDCNLRPLIDFQKQSSLKNDDLWVVDLMRVCWEKDPMRRPSFEEIVYLLSRKINQMKELIIRIAVKGAKTPHQEKFILMKKSYENLERKICTRWPSSNIVNIYVYDAKSGNPARIDDTMKDEFEKLIMNEDDPLVLVEFEELPIEEEIMSNEDLVGRLNMEKIERQREVEKNSELVKEIEELKERLKLSQQKIKELEIQDNVQ